MNKNDAIMMITTTTQSVAIGGTIPLTTIARRRGCAFDTTVSNNIIATKPGYYTVKGTVTVSAPVAGNATIRLVKNSTPVEGMVSTETITTATTEIRTLPISGTVRIFCNEGTANFSLIASDIALNVLNAELDFVYIG